MKYLLVAWLIGACGMDHDIESKVTIDQGVYGLLIAGEIPAADQTVMVYRAGSPTVFATMTSDHDGVYQIDLVTGDYTLCTANCTPISTSSSALVRYDWTSGPGGGVWQQQP
jgi:hypothetical protein